MGVEYLEEKFEGITDTTRNRHSKDRECNSLNKNDKTNTSPDNYTEK